MTYMFMEVATAYTGKITTLLRSKRPISKLALAARTIQWARKLMRENLKAVRA